MSEGAAQRAARPSADPVLLARLSQGEVGALGELYDRHQHAVRRFVSRATGDAEDVDDLVHKTFLTAAKCAARFDGRDDCRPWLMGIAVRLLQQRRRASTRLLVIVAALRNTRPTAHDARPQLVVRSDLARALGRLSEPKRVALLLTEVEGLSCPEVAELLGVPVGTVWTRLHAARRELRELLGANPGGQQP